MELSIGQKAKSFLEAKSFYGVGLRPFLVPEEQVSDINTEEDYKNLIKINFF